MLYYNQGGLDISWKNHGVLNNFFFRLSWNFDKIVEISLNFVKTL